MTLLHRKGWKMKMMMLCRLELCDLAFVKEMWWIFDLWWKFNQLKYLSSDSLLFLQSCEFIAEEKWKWNLILGKHLMEDKLPFHLFNDSAKAKINVVLSIQTKLTSFPLSSKKSSNIELTIIFQLFLSIKFVWLVSNWTLIEINVFFRKFFNIFFPKIEWWWKKLC